MSVNISWLMVEVSWDAFFSGSPPQPGWQRLTTMSPSMGIRLLAVSRSGKISDLEICASITQDTLESK